MELQAYQQGTIFSVMSGNIMVRHGMAYPVGKGGCILIVEKTCSHASSRASKEEAENSKTGRKVKNATFERGLKLFLKPENNFFSSCSIKRCLHAGATDRGEEFSLVGQIVSVRSYSRNPVEAYRRKPVNKTQRVFTDSFPT